MTQWKIDRTAVFLGLIFVLFLWDLAYFLGIRDPKIFPHPFVVFRTLGDVEFLRGFGRMLRLIILFFVSGGLIGIAIGSLSCRSSWLTHAVLHFLRFGLWLPFIVIFAVPDVFLLGIAAVTLSSCYHCVAARSILGLQGREAWTYVLREAILHALFFALISQSWFQYWDWSSFPYRGGAGVGFGVLTVLVVILFLVNWIFRSDFELSAGRHGTILIQFGIAGAGNRLAGFFCLRSRS